MAAGRAWATSDGGVGGRRARRVPGGYVIRATPRSCRKTRLAGSALPWSGAPAPVPRDAAGGPGGLGRARPRARARRRHGDDRQRRRASYGVGCSLTSGAPGVHRDAAQGRRRFDGEEHIAGSAAAPARGHRGPAGRGDGCGLRMPPHSSQAGSGPQHEPAPGRPGRLVGAPPGRSCRAGPRDRLAGVEAWVSTAASGPVCSKASAHQVPGVGLGPTPGWSRRLCQARRTRRGFARRRRRSPAPRRPGPGAQAAGPWDPRARWRCRRRSARKWPGTSQLIGERLDLLLEPAARPAACSCATPSDGTPLKTSRRPGAPAACWCIPGCAAGSTTTTILSQPAPAR